MTHIKPHGFTRNIRTDVVLQVNGNPVFSVVKPSYIPVQLLGVPVHLDVRRDGWLTWMPTPPPAGSCVVMTYSATF